MHLQDDELGFAFQVNIVGNKVFFKLKRVMFLYLSHFCRSFQKIHSLRTTFNPQISEIRIKFNAKTSGNTFHVMWRHLELILVTISRAKKGANFGITLSNGQPKNVRFLI